MVTIRHLLTTRFVVLLLMKYILISMETATASMTHRLVTSLRLTQSEEVNDRHSNQSDSSEIDTDTRHNARRENEDITGSKLMDFVSNEERERKNSLIKKESQENETHVFQNDIVSTMANSPASVDMVGEIRNSLNAMDDAVNKTKFNTLLGISKFSENESRIEKPYQRTKRDSSCSRTTRQRSICSWEYEYMTNYTLVPPTVRAVSCRGTDSIIENMLIHCQQLYEVKTFHIRGCDRSSGQSCRIRKRVKSGCLATLPCVMESDN